MKNQFLLEGTVRLVGEVETITEKFSKRLLVIGNSFQTKAGGTFEKNVAIEFSGEAMSLLDNVSVGQELEVQCEADSRESKGRYFTSIKPAYPAENAIKTIEGETANKVEEIVEQASQGNGSDLPF